MSQALNLKLADKSCIMKPTNCIFLVLFYQFYLGACQPILSPEMTEMNCDPLSDGHRFANLLPLNGSKEALQNEVTFQLYTRSDPTSYTTLTPTEEADFGDFNSQRKTKFIIHGWRSNGDYLAHIRKRYLEAGDYNVIVVDWSKPAANLYLIAISHLNLIGEYLASLIDLMVSNHALRLEDVHIIGHSLGAQMAGVAGNMMKSGKPERITGLDPAAPLFCCLAPEDRLDFTDGQFVDVIHTCGGLLGWKAPIGHADFYPNGGTAVQPGCVHDPEGYEGNEIKDIYAAISCSHGRAHEYFAESIATTSDFVSYECPNWDDYKDGKCLHNSKTLMGEFTDINSRGSYYLQTAKSSPYALGITSTFVESAQKELPPYLKNLALC